MGQFFSVSSLSENLKPTPDGYLICENVSIARAGALTYMEGETSVTAVDGKSTIYRTIEDLTDPTVMSSFEGMPVTLDHPESKVVNSDTWSDLSVGTIHNVRQGEGIDGDKLVADLMINDREAVQAIKENKLRQVSCGYLAEFEEIKPGLGRQTNIRGNHLAIVEFGRNGPECAIIDRLPDEIGKNMKPIKTLFKKVVDESPANKEDETNDEMDVNEILSNFHDRLAALESIVMTSDSDPDPDDDEKKVGDEDPDMKKDKTADSDPLGKVSEMLEQILSAVVKVNDSEDKPKESKTVVDEFKGSKQETFSRAEILCPGIADCKDIKSIALDSAYGTEDGKKAIEMVLDGKPYEEADKDMLFVASAEVLKGIRGGKLGKSFSMDSKPSSSTPPTPEEINRTNEEYYSKGAK